MRYLAPLLNSVKIEGTSSRILHGASRGNATLYTLDKDGENYWSHVLTNLTVDQITMLMALVVKIVQEQQKLHRLLSWNFQEFLI